MPSVAIAPGVAIKRILVATDFSEMSERVLGYAASFARRRAFAGIGQRFVDE